MCHLRLAGGPGHGLARQLDPMTVLNDCLETVAISEFLGCRRWSDFHARHVGRGGVLIGGTSRASEIEGHDRPNEAEDSHGGEDSVVKAELWHRGLRADLRRAIEVWSGSPPGEHADWQECKRQGRARFAIGEAD